MAGSRSMANAATPYSNTVWRRAMSTKATGDERKDERPSISDSGAGPAVVEEGGKASGGRRSDETGQCRWLFFFVQQLFPPFFIKDLGLVSLVRYSYGVRCARTAVSAMLLLVAGAVS